MASVNFFIRGKKIKSNIWVRFRTTNEDIRITTKETIEPENWSMSKQRSKDKEVNSNLDDLKAKILKAYDKNLEITNWKQWLTNIINPNHSTIEDNIPKNLIDFIDVFIESIKLNAKKSTIDKTLLLKKMLISFNTKTKNEFNNIEFLKLDKNFKSKFESYCIKSLNYKPSYVNDIIKRIKIILKEAEEYNIVIDKSIINWKYKYSEDSKIHIKPIFLSFDELEKIENSKQPTESLENVKKWLLISCYTGQRVSDFMNFTIDMIKKDAEGIEFLEFVQKKTNKTMRIPLLKKVKEIIEQNNGNFPYKIAEQNYNNYLKLLCKNAEINSIVYGGKMKGNRKHFDNYPKYELVSSHIGRRSLASNFYSKIPTSIIMQMTGHSTEKILLKYIGKADNDKAKETAIAFKSLGF